MVEHWRCNSQILMLFPLTVVSPTARIAAHWGMCLGVDFCAPLSGRTNKPRLTWLGKIASEQLFPGTSEQQNR